MPSVGDIHICNIALGWLGAQQISSFDEGTQSAIYCRQNYAPSRDECLESHDWSFARARASIVPDTTAPLWGYPARYILPTDCARLLDVRTVNQAEVGGEGERPSTLQWEVVGDYVEASEVADNLFILYTRLIDDPSRFSSKFKMALAALLAANMAIPLTKSRSLMGDMQKLYLARVGDASTTDGLQGRSKVFRSTHLTRRR